MFAIQITVKVSGKERAEERGFIGASVDIEYPVVPRKGEYVSLHGGVRHLKVKKVIHWGPSFADGPWTELVFKASLKEIVLLLHGRESETYAGWYKLEA